MNLNINGEHRTFDAHVDMPLLWVLRNVLDMTGTKFGCGIAQCELGPMVDRLKLLSDEPQRS